jgi:MFS family permease
MHTAFLPTVPEPLVFLSLQEVSADFPDSLPRVSLRYHGMKRSSLATLALILMRNVLDGANLNVFTIFLVPIAKTYHLSLVATTSMETLSLLTGVIGALAFGPLADRRGRRTALMLSILTFSLASVGWAVSRTPGVLLLTRLLAGLGLGGEMGCGVALIHELWPAARRGLATGLLQLGYAGGTMLAAFLFSVTVAPHGLAAWRWTFVYLAVSGGVVFLLRGFLAESPLWLRAVRREPKSSPRAIPWGPLGLFSILAFFGTSLLAYYAPTARLTIYHAVPHLQELSVSYRFGHLSPILALAHLTGGGEKGLLSRPLCLARWGICGSSFWSLRDAINVCPLSHRPRC